MKKTIFTHATTKALRGIQRLADDDTEVHLWPVPYPRSDGQSGWTVAVIRNGR